MEIQIDDLRVEVELGRFSEVGQRTLLPERRTEVFQQRFGVLADGLLLAIRGVAELAGRALVFSTRRHGLELAG